MPQRVLVVDDEMYIVNILDFTLATDGLEVVSAANGEEALKSAIERTPDLVILDVMMPEMDGLEVCRRLRAEHPLPIIFLSSKGEEIDRIIGLELGGDDYLAKPFSPRELVARIKAVLRRQHASATASPQQDGPLRVGPVTLDQSRHEVTCEGSQIALTVTEFAVLLALLRRPGQVMTRQVLVEAAYSASHHITERTIDTHIRRIRAKFRPTGHDPIETVHGVGYKAREA